MASTGTALLDELATTHTLFCQSNLLRRRYTVFYHDYFISAFRHFIARMNKMKTLKDTQNSHMNWCILKYLSLDHKHAIALVICRTGTLLHLKLYVWAKQVNIRHRLPRLHLHLSLSCKGAFK